MSQNPFQSAARGALTVSDQEAGMKLLRFLERRLPDVPRSALHKWIRTGQTRVNKGRAGPFQILAAGDAVRLPPFALRETTENSSGPAPADGQDAFARPDAPTAPRGSLGEDVRIVSFDDELLVLAKPSGLACQGGSATTDSLAARLRAAFGERRFIPAPAHRLDKQTSGLVLAGMTHAWQRRLHEWFKSGAMEKEYLAWIPGVWPGQEPLLLTDVLVRETDALTGRETIAALPGGKTEPLASPPCHDMTRGKVAPPDVPAGGAVAGCAVMAVQTMPWPGSAPPGGEKSASLLLLRLLSGRKHQIRVQLASRGHPIIGDRRYHGPVFSRMLLHAYALSLPPDGPAPAVRQRQYTCPPDWPSGWMPDPDALARARAGMARMLPPPRGEALLSRPHCCGEGV